MFSLDELISEFVESLQQEKTGRTYETYRRKILVFQEFIVQEYDLSVKNCETMLTGLKPPAFLSSIRYYVETYHIGYKATVDTFLVALNMFFTYIGEKHNLQNACFNDKAQYKDLKEEYDKLAISLELNDKDTIYPPDAEEYQRIYNLCNKYLSMYSTEDILSGRHNGIYTNYISSLIVKFTSLYGLRNEMIDGLKISDYCPVYNTIDINRYHVHLPDSLGKELQRYIAEIRSRIVLKENSISLFVDITGTAIKSGKKYAVAEQVLGHRKGNSICKYAIMQMIKVGLPAHMIMEFTGFSHVVYNHCVELVDEDCEGQQLKEKSSKMDSSLRRIPTFDEL